MENKIFLNDPSTPHLAIDIIAKPEYISKVFKFMNKKAYPSAYLNSILLNYINEKHGSFLKQNNLSLNRIIGINIKENQSKMNAFYDRKSITFNSASNINGDIIRTYDSHDISAHEMGHAILDQLNPNIWSILNIEINAFHESFADITAMVSLSLHNEIIDKYKYLEDNKEIFQIGEEMGKSIFSLSSGKYGTTYCLRDASKKLYYINPKDLPNDGPESTLTSQRHNFSRVLTSMWFDLWLTISKKIKSKEIARDICYELILKAAIYSPRTLNYFGNIANTMIEHCEYEFKSILSEKFEEWNIKISDMKIMNISKKNKNKIIRFDKDLSALNLQNSKKIYIPQEEEDIDIFLCHASNIIESKEEGWDFNGKIIKRKFID